MKINVKRLLDINGDKQELCCEIDLSSYKQMGKSVIPKPVELKISLVNRATILTLHYKALFEERCVCDRCLKEEWLKREYEFTHTLVRRLEGTEDEGYLLVPHDELDMREIAADDIRLELSGWHLCKKDCKGLCPTCGADRNEQECGCVVNNIDPRLEVLKKLL